MKRNYELLITEALAETNVASTRIIKHNNYIQIGRRRILKSEIDVMRFPYAILADIIINAAKNMHHQLPNRIKSINLPSNGISATRTPSLYASND